MIKKNKGLTKKILHQIEYYFSTQNLKRDKFLRNEITTNPQGFVPLTVLITFNKLKALSTDIDYISKVLKESKVLLLSEDGKSVKTPDSLPEFEEMIKVNKPTSLQFLDKTFEYKVEIKSFFHDILYSHSEGEFLDDKETAYIIELLKYHQKSSEKIGNGVDKIKIGKSPQHLDSRCFIIIRKDNSEVDFSYMKCIGEIPLHEKKIEKTNKQKKKRTKKKLTKKKLKTKTKNKNNKRNFYLLQVVL